MISLLAFIISWSGCLSCYMEYDPNTSSDKSTDTRGLIHGTGFKGLKHFGVQILSGVQKMQKDHYQKCIKNVIENVWI